LKKHSPVILLFTLVSFYFLTTDVLMVDKAVLLLGESWAVLAYSAAMLALGAGFILFSFLYRKAAGAGRQKALISTAFLLSPAALLVFVTAQNTRVFAASAAIHMCATGIIGAWVHYVSAMRLRELSHTGRVIGIAVGLEALLQVLMLGAFASAPMRSLSLIIALGAAYLLTVREKLLEPAFSFESEQSTARAEKPAKGYLPALIAIVAVISLMGGLNDGLIIGMQTGSGVNIYSYPRLFYLAGVVAAGFIADFRSRRYLPVAILCVMLLSPIGVMFLNSPETYAVNLCVFFLFAGFAILYFTVVFLDIAPQTNNPMLWAGMGRTIRFFFLAFGNIVSGVVFQAIPFIGIIAAYIGLSVLLCVLFFLSGSLGRSRHSASLPMPEKNDMMDKAARYYFTKRELEVLSCLLDGMSNRDIALCLHVSERTVKFHIANIYDKARVKNRMELLLILNRP
jgi:DNA-binding CsgD family transcriptional regulator